MTGESGEMHRAEEAFGGVVPRPYENPPAAPKPGFGFEKPNEGDTNDWLTPPRLVKMLGEFDLDPCACASSKMPPLAVRLYAPPQNGLLLPWAGRVWCNPPYGPHVEAWVRKMASHRDGVLLIFSRTETVAWRHVWDTGDAFLFPEGRVSFFRPDGRRAKSGTAPSSLIAYGDRNVEALRTCGIKGAFFRRVENVGRVRASSL